MRASGSGPIGMFLIVAPLLAVPVLAVVGIPEFAPVKASPAGEEEQSLGEASEAPAFSNLTEKRPRSGQSDRYSADDLFAPLPTDDRIAVGSERGQERRFDEDFASEFPDAAPRGNRSRELALADQAEAPRRPLRDGWDEPADKQQADASQEFPEIEEPRSSRRGQSNVNNDDQEANPFLGREEASPRKSRERSPRDLFQEESTDPPGWVDNQPPVERTPSRGPKTNPFSRKQAKELAKKPPEESVDDSTSTLGEAAPNAELFQNQRRTNAPEAEMKERRAPNAGGLTKRGETLAEKEAVADAPEEFTWRIASQRLKQLGISKHYFTYLEDQDSFLFHCSMTPKQQPGVTQRFQAEADEPLLAVREVLQQVEEWQAAQASNRNARRRIEN